MGVGSWVRVRVRVRIRVRGRGRVRLPSLAHLEARFVEHAVVRHPPRVAVE